MAGAVAEDTSSFGVTYQYTASSIVHRFLAVILFTVLWHSSMMPLPEGMYAQRDRSRTLHLSRKVLNRLLQRQCQNLSAGLLIEEHLQLVYNTCRILSRKTSPDGKPSVPVAERVHLRFLRGKIVHGITTTTVKRILPRSPIHPPTSKIDNSAKSHVSNSEANTKSNNEKN